MEENSFIKETEMNDTFKLEDEIVINDLCSHRRNSDRNLTTDFANITINTVVTNEPLGLDFDNFVSSTMDQTVHSISQSNDLSIMLEINEGHNTYVKAMSGRNKGLKTISNYWSVSNIDFTLNSLKMLNISFTNDFFKYAFNSRKDVDKFGLTLDHALLILPLCLKLITNQYEVYSSTGVITSNVMLKCFSERLNTFSGQKSDDQKYIEVVECFNKILACPHLKQLCQRNKSPNILKEANSLYTDLEFFLMPFYRNRNVK